jgi:hypothetical protein
MKTRLASLLPLAMSLSLVPPAHADDYQGSSFAEVWQQVASDPYATLPQEEVRVDRFFGNWFVDHLLIAAKRTLSSRADLLPYFDKLVHPNGICLAGEWEITEPTPYTGYFAMGSRALFIARASTALTPTKRGQWRSFGFAGKLFPTLDAWTPVPTANFVTIENLGGTLREHFLDAENTNDIILINPTPEAAWNGPVGLVAARDFAIADGTLDVTRPLIRQLYPISEAGGVPPAQAKTPKWMMITGAEDVPRASLVDFRDELRLENYPGGLRFDILVSSLGTRIGPKIWDRIGTIHVYETVASESCDHRLHFAHAPWRN